MTNKKGTEKMMSVYWFVILFMVAAAVVYMAGVFYGAPYDVREVESRFLSNAVADCLVRGGNLTEDILDENFQENLLEICDINFEVEDVFKWGENPQYYLELNIYDFETYSTGVVALDTFYFGDINLRDFCFLENEKCSNRNLYVLEESSQEKYILNIFTAVNKQEKNVK